MTRTMSLVGSDEGSDEMVAMTVLAERRVEGPRPARRMPKVPAGRPRR